MPGGSVSRLLLALTGILVAALVLSAGFIAASAGNRYVQATRTVDLVDTDRVLFDAVIALRGQIPRAQTALLGENDPGPAIQAARVEATRKTDQAVAALTGIELAERDALIEALVKARAPMDERHSLLESEARRPRAERDVRATEPWRQTVLGIQDALMSASAAVSDSVRRKDVALAELVGIRRAAWRIRDAFGWQCSGLRANVQNSQPPDAKFQAVWRPKLGVVAVGWQELDELLVRPVTPAAAAVGLVDTARAARAAVEAAQTRIDATVAGLDHSGKAAMPAAEWTRLCNAPFEPILAIGGRALEAAVAYALDARRQALGELALALAGLALAGVLGPAVVVVVRRRLTVPLAAVAQAMRAVSKGRLDIEVPCQERHAELGAIGGGIADILAALRILRDEMDRLSGDLAGEPGEVAVEGDYADMVALLRETRHAFIEIGEQATAVAVAAGQADGAVGQVAEGAGAQTDNLDQVVIAIGQSVVAISQVSDSTRDVAETVQAASAFAGRGKQDMTRLLKVSQTIADNSRRIGRIAEAITEITEQTNILSFNAAIEAARAGPHGRGFSVVAGEVRKLAGNAAESTGQIREIIVQAMALAEEGMTVTGEAWRMMDELAGRVAKAEGMIQSIVVAIEEQRATVGAIEGNVAAVRQVAQKNARASDEIATTMGRLARLADQTRRRLARFKA